MAKFKARTLKITIDDPEEAQLFLNGLILARQNNSSEYFPQLIDGVNAIMEPYTAELIAEQKAGIGPNAKVQVD